METIVVLVVLALALAYALRRASRTVDRIIDEETGPRVDGDRPGRSEDDPRGPAV